MRIDIMLGRGDLGRREKDLPIDRISILDFPHLSNDMHRMATTIVFVDGSEQREFKNKYRGVESKIKF